MKWPVTPVPADVTALRPLGVTRAACLLAANSAVTLIVGVFAVIWQLQHLPRSEFEMFGRLGALLLAAVVAVLVVVEVVTAVGLWRMRAWARFTALLLAGVLVPFHALATLGRYLSADLRSSAFGATQVLLGLAALVYFLRPPVRQAFSDRPHGRMS